MDDNRLYVGPLARKAADESDTSPEHSRQILEDGAKKLGGSTHMCMQGGGLGDTLHVF